MKTPVVVLDWRAWQGYLLPHVLGETALRVPVHPLRDFALEELDGVTAGVSIVCFNIDLTIRSGLPLDINKLNDHLENRGIFVVNSKARDISKRSLHQHLDRIGLPSAKAGRDGSPDEKLFVKTNLNYGGAMEKRLYREEGGESGMQRLFYNEMGPTSYRVLRRLEIPEGFWEDQTLLIERYLTNAEKVFFRVYFSGTQLIIVKAHSNHVIKKIGRDARDVNYVLNLEQLKTGSDRLPLDPRLRRTVATFVEETPVEFGCIDLVKDETGSYFVIDLNLTPFAGQAKPDFKLNRHLRLGITEPRRRKSPPPLSTATI